MTRPRGVFVLVAALAVAPAAEAQATTATASPAALAIDGLTANARRSFTVVLTNTGQADLAVAAVMVPRPISTDRDECTGYSIPPRQSCTIMLSIASPEATAGSAIVRVAANVAGGGIDVPISWRIDPFPVVASTVVQRFGYQPIGQSDQSSSIQLTNVSAARVAVRLNVLSNTTCTALLDIAPECAQRRRDDVASFTIGTCDGLDPGQSCTLPIRFAPTALGALGANIVVLVGEGGFYVHLLGVGIPTQTVAGTIIAIEYFRVAPGNSLHWFMTATPMEIDKLDNQLPTWTRSDEMFWVWPADSDEPGTTPVCRFYGRPEAGLDSHFYSASPQECADVATRFANAWLLESPAYFRVKLPDPATGACPAATRPVHRAYNQRPDANHMYSLSADWVRAQRVIGWVPEGYGPDAVVFCVPA